MDSYEYVYDGYNANWLLLLDMFFELYPSNGAAAPRLAVVPSMRIAARLTKADRDINAGTSPTMSSLWIMNS
jgi:hypothetical protein